MMTDDGHVTYTVKEILARIEGKVDSIDLKLQAKADRADLLSLRSRVESIELVGSKEARESFALARQLETRLLAVEKSTLTTDALARYKRWLVITAVPAALGAAWALLRMWELYRTGAIGS